MTDLTWQFEWDKNKAQVNQIKHGVTFRLAMSALRDPMAITIYDDEHSEFEERWITIGLALNGQCLVVVHTMTQINDATLLVRIISARKANRMEQQDYKESPH